MSDCPYFMPYGCGMMAFMSEETRDRLIRASRNYRRLKLQLDGARGELADAIVAMRLEGALIEDITAVVPYRQTQVNRILKTAGLVQERHRASPVEAA